MGYELDLLQFERNVKLLHFNINSEGSCFFQKWLIFLLGQVHKLHKIK